MANRMTGGFLRDEDTGALIVSGSAQSGSLDDLTDVDTTGGAEGDVLTQQADGSYALEPSSGGTTITKRVTLPLVASGDDADVSGHTSFIQGERFALPVTPTRFRFRMRNAAAYDNHVNTGAIDITGFYIGEPKYKTDAAGGNEPGVYRGERKAVPTQVIGAFTTASNGAETTTAWVDAADFEIEAGKEYVLTYGATLDSGTSVVSSARGGICSIDDGTDEAATADAFGSQLNLCLLDVRIEYEFDTPEQGGVPVVLVLGDSTASGINSSPAGTAPHAHERWPDVMGLIAKAAVINNGVGGSFIGDAAGATRGWSSGTGDWRWTRIDVATTVPDIVIIALGTNDTNNNVALNDSKTDMDALVQYCQTTLGIRDVMFATIAPFGASGTEEGLRGTYNAWYRTRPWGAPIIEFDRALRRPVIGATTSAGDALDWSKPDPALNPGGTLHPGSAGYEVQGQVAAAALRAARP